MTYLKSVLDESISGEAMRLQLIYKINEKLKFLYRKNKVLPELSSMLCHALIQSHLDYGCPAWYLNLNKKKKQKRKYKVCRINACNFALELIKYIMYLLQSLDQ